MVQGTLEAQSSLWRLVPSTTGAAVTLRARSGPGQYLPPVFATATARGIGRDFDTLLLDACLKEEPPMRAGLANVASPQAVGPVRGFHARLAGNADAPRVPELRGHHSTETSLSSYAWHVSRSHCPAPWPMAR